LTNFPYSLTTICGLDLDPMGSVDLDRDQGRQN
jgi:hypothetical protein